MRRRTAVGLLLVSLGFARDGYAQAPNADELTRQGLALRRQRRDAEALESFRRAYALRPTPRTLAQIALAEQALGHWVDAEAELRNALQATDDPWIAQHRPVLVAGLADIQTHLGGLEVEADAPGAELWLNGAHATSLPVTRPMRVEAGSVVIDVRAAGYAPARRITSVEAGETARETIHLVPLVPAAPVAQLAAMPRPPVEPPPARPAAVIPPDRPMRAASFVLLGAAAVGMTAGAYFGVRTFVTKSDRDNHCSPGCDSTGVALDGEAHAHADRATAWFVLGTVAAGAGAGLLWLSRGRTVPGGAPSLRVGFDVGPWGANATLGGPW
jgi:hypothetical protein